MDLPMYVTKLSYVLLHRQKTRARIFSYPKADMNPSPAGGGLGVTQNRTHWPISGGALAVQPGWNSGHKTALMFINLGLGESPKNYSMVMVPRFQLTGPSNQEYEGTFCLPQVPLPAGVTPKEGDLASIQVVEAAQHGAALFSVRCLTKCYRLSKYFMSRGSVQRY